LVANTVFPMVQAAFALTPLLLAAIELSARYARATPGGLLPHGRTAAALVGVAVLTALVAVAGHVEMLYYAALVCAAYGLFRATALGRATSAGAGVRLLVWLVAAALCGALVAGVQLVPLVELAAANWRSGSEPYETIVGYAFGLRQLVTFLLPDAYGNPAHHAVWDLARRAPVALPSHAMWGTAWGTKNYVEAAGYLGLLVPLLAVVGLLSGRRRSSAVFFGGLALLSLSFVFGLPSYRLLFLLPGVDQLHTPFRWLFPFALSAVVLAGLGADRLYRGARPSAAGRWLGASAVGTGLVVAAGLAVAYSRPGLWERLVTAGTPPSAPTSRTSQRSPATSSGTCCTSPSSSRWPA
jgi:hypothetical protein